MKHVLRSTPAFIPAQAGIDVSVKDLFAFEERHPGSRRLADTRARMQAILAVTVPFFALILLGCLAARQRALPEAPIPGLNAYVLFFALPCMLFRFGASMPFARLIASAFR